MDPLSLKSNGKKMCGYVAHVREVKPGFIPRLWVPKAYGLVTSPLTV